MKYIKKQVVVDVIRWDGNNQDEITNFVGKHVFSVGYNELEIPLERNISIAHKGDYIVKDYIGESYAISPEAFEHSYELFTEE